MSAFERGSDYYAKGILINPYPHGTTKFFDWFRGWYAAQSKEAINLFQVAQRLASRESEKKRLADENYLEQQQKNFKEYNESLLNALKHFCSKHIEVGRLLEALLEKTESLQKELESASVSTSDRTDDNPNLS